MNIHDALTDDQIRRCHPVMAQLRAHVPAEGFVERVRRLEAGGFRMAYVTEDGTPDGPVRAVAGYRFLEQLVNGKALYVDDLVTDEAARGAGYGEALLEWLHALARRSGCATLELDSGTQRERAHRFYFRHGMTIRHFHFVRPC